MPYREGHSSIHRGALVRARDRVLFVEIKEACVNKHPYYLMKDLAGILRKKTELSWDLIDYKFTFLSVFV